ncbi:3076_t:CDS:1 [Dentiscutata heterogama]|uniref:3076_t:CDS:1 n=1 Tax=Dentiscutata heterogama TaxID=1316150 RepID=A0ACA9NZC0_9GLOM|nr:3076_t:CDS:1 [Dentiscutata heterogama]
MSHQIFIKLPVTKTQKKVICPCNICKSEKEPCNPQTKDAYIAKYRVCKELLSTYEPYPNISSPTDSQIGPSSISSINISLSTLLDPEFQKSFLVTKNKRKKAKAIIREQPDIDIVLKTLNISNNEEEVAEIEPDSDNEKTIMDYSAPNIENEDKEEFEHIDNLDNSFDQILI